MKLLTPGFALMLAAAWGCSGGAEIPPVELGGSTGARLMNGQARTPAEAYDNAYALLTRSHYNVRRNLDTRGQNQLGAREAMAQIIRCLETMKSCVPAGNQVPFDPYIARYSGWLTDLEKGTWGGAFLTDFERNEREVKSNFHPSNEQFLTEFPGAKPEAPPVKPADSPLISDNVEVPATPRSPGLESPRPAPEAPGVDPVVTLRLLYRSWSTAHDELIAAYRARIPCKGRYDEVLQSLRLLKEKHAGDKAAKLQIYIDYYADVGEKTRGFCALPEKTTEKDILDELDVAARVIRKEFNPDR